MLTTVTRVERLHLTNIAHDDCRHGALTELLLSFAFQFAFFTKFCDTKSSTASSFVLSSSMSQLHEPTHRNAWSDRSRDAKTSSR